MKIKNYLSVGAVIVGSAAMVACDGDDVTVTETVVNLNESIAVAPVPLAQFPLTSLKLAFDNGVTACAGQSFSAGDELELDFDSTTADASDDIDGDARADADITGGAGLIVFGQSTEEAIVTGIVTDPTDSSWSIETVNIAGADVLAGLEFRPLASDLRSVTGSFWGSAFNVTNVNADDTHVYVTADGFTTFTTQLDIGNSTFVNIVSATVFSDGAAGNDLEITSIDGGDVYEAAIGAGNLVVSLTSDTDCVYNFIVSFDEINGIITSISDDEWLESGEADALTAYLNLNNSVTNTFDVSGDDADIDPAGNGVAQQMIAAPGTGVSYLGSYRQDFDSSTGQNENGINSENEIVVP